MTGAAAGAAYVALGDSISIDEYAGGPGRGGAALLARNRDDDFPAWRGRDLASTRPDLAFRLLATDGGTTRSLLDGQLPRLAASGVVPEVVTLTIGGNTATSSSPTRGAPTRCGRRSGPPWRSARTPGDRGRRGPRVTAVSPDRG